MAAKFLAAVLARPKVKRHLSGQHFSADGTLIEAWASLKSFKPKPDEAEGEGGPPEDGAGGEGDRAGGRNVEVHFKGERRSNATHRSTTDPEALLYRKGPGMEARLCYIGHGLMENRSGLIVDARLTLVSGHAERLAALEMIEPHADSPRAITLGADKGYDAADFVEELRTMNVRPHVAPKAPLGDRRAHDPACRLCDEPARSANASKRPSAGSRPSRGSARPALSAAPRRTGPSLSQRRPTTWCVCRS